MENNLVSIVMATYNGEKYLREQLDSIIEQTYKNIELIVVDDCSQDSTLDILVAYQASHNFIKIYRNESNMGVSQTFSFGITKAIGDYVAFCDQDDVWLPNKIEILISEVGDNLLICSPFIAVDSKLCTLNKDVPISKLPRVCFADYLIGNNVTGCCAMISRELIELAMPIPKEFYMHDYYFALYASYHNRLKRISIPLVYYRQHGNNVLGSTRQTYDQFIQRSKLHYVSLESLQTKSVFVNNEDLKLMILYRKSIYCGSSFGLKNFIKLMKFNHGFKLTLLYFVVRGTNSYCISKFLFTQLRKYI